MDVDLTARAMFGGGPVRAAFLIPFGIVSVVAAFAWRYACVPTSGFVFGLLTVGFRGFQPAGWIGSVIGAVIVLLI